MTISVPTSQELVSTTVVDPTRVYDRNVRAYYQKDQNWQEANSIYQFTPTSFTPDLYNEANESTYTLNKVLFKDNTTVKVSSIGTATVLKQPEEYTSGTDSTFTFNTWTKAWSKIQTSIPAGTYNGFTKVVDAVTHKLYRDSTSSTGWRYKIVYTKPDLYWGAEEYDLTSGNNTYYTWAYLTERTSILYHDVTKVTVENTTTPPTPYVSIYTGDDNIRYRCGANKYNINFVKKYGVQQERTRTTTYTFSTPAYVYDSIDSTSVILGAYCVDSADCGDKWLGRTFVIDGTNLYVRTAASTLETKSVTVPSYSIISQLKNFPGFSLIGDNLKYAPLDGKNYTKAIAPTTMSYVIRGTERFDTVALGNVKADGVVMLFKDSEGAIVETLSADIDCFRDETGDIEPWQTTGVFYAVTPMNANDTVEITLTGGVIELGTIMLGMSVDAGFTHLELQNSFIDYSTIAEDDWGNIDYVERAKVAVYKGTCDILITNYDRTVRLLTSLGGRLVILNGSDSKNVVPDSLNIFASTQLIGRLFDITQKTNIKEGDLDKIATYSFTLKEIV